MTTIGHVITSVAESIPYDNSVSLLTAEDLQAAVDELASGSADLPSDTIAASGTFSVGANRQLVVASCYTINSLATLTLTGTLAVL